jgi:hypothetical protein
MSHKPRYQPSYHKILLAYDKLMDEQPILSIPVIPQIILEGKNIHDIPSFYQEINRDFMQNEDWELGESLDASKERATQHTVNME